MSVSKYILTIFATCGRALSYRRMTLLYPFSYSDHFSENVRLKQMNCSKSESSIYSWPWSSSSYDSISLLSNYFGYSEHNAKITIFELLKSFPTWLTSWSNVSINFHKHSILFICTILSFQLKLKPKIFRKGCLVNAKSDVHEIIVKNIFFN